MTEPSSLLSRNDALMPCPFCGGEASFGTATIQRQKDDAGRYGTFTGHFVNCIICGVDNQGIAEGFGTREAAAEKWNRRFVEAGDEAVPSETKAREVTNAMLYAAQDACEQPPFIRDIGPIDLRRIIKAALEAM